MWGISITACCGMLRVCWWLTNQMIREEPWKGLHCVCDHLFIEILLFTIIMKCSIDLIGEYVWQLVDSLWLECESVSMITRNSSWQVTLTVTWLLLQLMGRHPFKRRLKATQRKIKRRIAFSYSTMITLSWSTTEELRCLFVREGRSEYFLGLWHHSCTRMLLEDIHRWDWACLNIIHSGWESLSRVMWRGLRNV